MNFPESPVNSVPEHDAKHQHGSTISPPKPKSPQSQSSNVSTNPSHSSTSTGLIDRPPVYPNNAHRGYVLPASSSQSLMPVANSVELRSYNSTSSNSSSYTDSTLLNRRSLGLRSSSTGSDSGSVSHSFSRSMRSAINPHPTSFPMWHKGTRSQTTHKQPRTAPATDHRVKGQLTIGLICIAVVCIASLAIYALLVAPVCATLSLALLGVFVFFVLTERDKSWFFHRRLGHEQRFWTLWMTALAATLIFAPDSPFASFFGPRPWLGVFCLIAIAGFWSDHERQTALKALQQPQVYVPSATESTAASPADMDAKEALAALQASLQRLSGTFSRDADRQRAAVLQALRAADTLALNYIVQRVGMAWLLHALQGPALRDAMSLLARERVGELDTVSKACVIDALQTARVMPHENANEWLASLIGSTKGVALTQLKCLLDTKGNVHSLHKLLWFDLGGSEADKRHWRGVILQHIQREAAAVKEALRAEGGGQRPRKPMPVDAYQLAYVRGMELLPKAFRSTVREEVRRAASVPKEGVSVMKESTIMESVNVTKDGASMMEAAAGVVNAPTTGQSDAAGASAASTAAASVGMGAEASEIPASDAAVNALAGHTHPIPNTQATAPLLPVVPDHVHANAARQSAAPAEDVFSPPATGSVSQPPDVCADPLTSNATLADPDDMTWPEVPSSRSWGPIITPPVTLPAPERGLSPPTLRAPAPEAADDADGASDSEVETFQPLPLADLLRVPSERAGESRAPPASSSSHNVLPDTALTAGADRTADKAAGASAQPVDKPTLTGMPAPTPSLSGIPGTAPATPSLSPVPPLPHTHALPLARWRGGLQVTPRLSASGPAGSQPSSFVLQQVSAAPTVSGADASDTIGATPLVTPTPTPTPSAPVSLAPTPVPTPTPSLSLPVPAPASVTVLATATSGMSAASDTSDSLLPYSSVDVHAHAQAPLPTLTPSPTIPPSPPVTTTASPAALLAQVAVNPGPLRKILSDVDDTLFSSGGKFPAGIDRAYAYHELYPGVVCLLKELDLGFDAVGVWTRAHGRGNLAFLSARPHVYKDKAERKSYHAFEALRRSHGLHAVPTLLAGTLDAGLSMLAGDYLPLARQKFSNFHEYAQLYPEYAFIFVGDNGQADVLAAEMMKDEYGDRVELCLIHLVQPLERTPGYTRARAEAWRRKGILFFKTYVGAAVHACLHRIIHPRGLHRVVRAALLDFARIHNEVDYEQWTRAVMAHVDRDDPADPVDTADAPADASNTASPAPTRSTTPAPTAAGAAPRAAASLTAQPFLRELHRAQLNEDILLAQALLARPEVARDEALAVLEYPAEVLDPMDAGEVALIPAIRTIPSGVVVTTEPDFGPLLVCDFDHRWNRYTLKLMPRRFNMPITLPPVRPRQRSPPLQNWTRKHPQPQPADAPMLSSTGQHVFASLASDLRAVPGRGDTLIYAPESALKLAVRPGRGARVVCMFGTGVLEGAEPNGFHNITIRDVRGAAIAHCHMKACDFAFIAAAKGDVVRTTLGSGVVVDYRVRDAMYVVALSWGTAYINPDSILGIEEKERSACSIM